MTQPTLTADLRDRWAAALRSGEYQQIRTGYLSSVDGDCCLGVLCKIAGRAQDLDGDYSWIREIIGDVAIDRFIDMNDHQYLTFSSIATEVDKLPVTDTGAEL